jgi:hypothetical protein
MFVVAYPAYSTLAQRPPDLPSRYFRNLEVMGKATCAGSATTNITHTTNARLLVVFLNFGCGRGISR